MTGSPRRLCFACPAKINLHLEVLGRRRDGYHELRTLFAAVGVWDTLILEEARGELTLAVHPEGSVPVGEENLVLRAARALQRRAQCRSHGTPGARLTLLKRIPIAGGMGGGSGNAAAALVGLNQLWGAGASPAELWEMAAGLGADVPFFLIGGVAWGSGRGDQLLPLPDLPPWWAVLLPSEVPVPTSQVYAALAAPPVGDLPPSPLYDWVQRGGELPLAACRNDLEPVVMGQFPRVKECFAAVAAHRPLLARMTGSGGTVFALFGSKEEAMTCANRLAMPSALVAPILTRKESQLRPTVEEEPWKSPMCGSP